MVNKIEIGDDCLLPRPFNFIYSLNLPVVCDST